MKKIPDGQKRVVAGDGGSLIPDSDFRLLFERLPGQFLILDPEFRIVAASDAYLSATMTKREEIVGRQMFDIFPDNPADPHAMGVRNLEASFRKVRLTGQADAMSLQKYDVRRPEEEGGGFDERYWSPVNSPVFGADGRLLYIVHRVEDVTDFVRQQKQPVREEGADELQLRAQRMEAEVYARAREAAEAHVQLKQANEQLAKMYEKTKELDRLKTEFFANVSHELRTPLTLILGPVERWLREGEVTGRLRHDLEVVYRNASLLLRHVNNLLDVARLEAGQMIVRYVRTDLARLFWFVGSAFDSFAAERNISYKIDTPKTLVAEIDPDKVQRILLNLISNAIKFTPSGGAVTLSLREEGNNAVVRVSDTGPGIPVSLREKIFERFQRVERGDQWQPAGTGLGLAIVKDFVHLHQGQAWVEEASGGGAVFTVSLPLEAPAGTDVQEELKEMYEAMGQEVDGDFYAEARSSAGPMSVAPPDAPLVLIVDDNRDMAAFEAEILGKSYRVVTAFDGVEGLEKALEHRPDLIVTDVMMPRMSGDDMSRRLRDIPELQDTPVLMVTARADEEFRMKVLREGLRSYLVKPFSVQEFLARAEGLVTERKLQQALRESERQYRVLFDKGPVPRWTLDMENFAILQVNEPAIISYGYSREEFQRLTLADIRTGEEFEKFRKWAEQCRAEGTPMEGEVQTLHRKKDGELVNVIADFTEVEFKGRRIILLAAVDITARKRAEEALEEANRELQTFNYSVAHDLRQPLNVISGYCQAIKMLCGDKLDEECADHLRGAYEGTLRMSQLIEALLKFSSLSRVDLHRETVDLSKMARELAEGLKVTNPERRVIFHIAEGVTVDGDPALLRVALDNLVGNAWKYTVIREEAIIEFGSVEIDGKPACFVRDNGPGFEMTDADKVFIPFKRLPGAEETRGFGIGLATVDRIIRRHGGKIWAEGDPGKGATFFFTLNEHRP